MSTPRPNNQFDGPESREDSASDQKRDAFARLFAAHDRWLFAYLVTLLSDPMHAEEVFQEVCVILWREHEKFQLGTDLLSGASVIAHNQGPQVPPPVEKSRISTKRRNARQDRRRINAAG